MFIKGRQKILDDVLTLIANIVVLEQYWINIETKNEYTSYSYILKLLIELVDTLSSAEFREIRNKFKSVCSFMAHTLISYIFDLFLQFVRLAQNSHVIREVNTSNNIPLEYIETSLMMPVYLMRLVKLCVATGSV